MASQGAGELLEIRSIAPLDIVSTENYLRYGIGGPQHDVLRTPEIHTLPHILTAHLTIKPAAGTELPPLALSFHQKHHLPHESTVWEAQDAERHLQIVWAWDFYRLLSHLHLQAECTPAGEAGDSVWSQCISALRRLLAGSLITLTSPLKSGDIVQHHTLDKPAQSVQTKK